MDFLRRAVEGGGGGGWLRRHDSAVQTAELVAPLLDHLHQTHCENSAVGREKHRNLRPSLSTAAQHIYFSE